MRLIELSPPGRKVITGTMLFTAEDIIRFAQKYDPQYRSGPASGGLCAPARPSASGML
jgi:hypothetical protein